MAIVFNHVRHRSATRLRLEFDETLAIGAYAIGWFLVECLDASTGDITVRAVYAMPGQPGVVEIVLDTPLTPGSDFQVTVLAGFPGISTVLAADTAIRFRTPTAAISRTRGTIVKFDIFGRDARHDGHDFVEAADGDLDTVSGVDNALAAAKRRLVSEGLMWATDYGLQGEDVIDSPVLPATALQSRARRQLSMDDRIESTKVSPLNTDTMLVLIKFFGEDTDVPTTFNA